MEKMLFIFIILISSMEFANGSDYVKVFDDHSLDWKDPKCELPHDNELVLVCFSDFMKESQMSGKVYSEDHQKYVLIYDKWKLPFSEVRWWALQKSDNSNNDD